MFQDKFKVSYQKNDGFQWFSCSLIQSKATENMVQICPNGMGLNHFLRDFPLFWNTIHGCTTPFTGHRNVSVTTRPNSAEHGSAVSHDPRLAHPRHDVPGPMEKLTGSWIPSTFLSSPPVIHVIQQGRLVWDHGTSGKVWSLRADPVQKYGPNHFSIGERKRKGTRPSTLKKCILRSSCSLQWTSPQVAERWTRFAPVLSSFEKVQLVNADESDLALVDMKLEKIVNLQQLRSLARRLRFPGCDCSTDDVSLTEVSSGRVLQDESDLVSSEHPEHVPVIRASSYISDTWVCLVGDLAYVPNGKSTMTGESIVNNSEYVLFFGHPLSKSKDMISRNSLELIFTDGKHRDIDLCHVKSIPDIFAALAQQTQRPESFISLEIRRDGNLSTLERFHHLQGDSAVIQVHLTETVAEWWLSKRLIIVDVVGHLATLANLANLGNGDNGETTDSLRCLRCLDLSEARSLSDAHEAIGRHTSRPARFVRFLEGKNLKELKVWSPNQFPELTLTLQLAPCIHELLQSGLQLKYLSGDAFDFIETEKISLVGIQDLREAIATRLKLRATAVSLITSSGKNLWDSDPFDLCDITETSETITLCLRNPELCLQGHHDIHTFCNGGYFDQVCIHCGDEFFMEGRKCEPRRCHDMPWSWWTAPVTTGTPRVVQCTESCRKWTSRCLSFRKSDDDFLVFLYHNIDTPKLSKGKAWTRTKTDDTWWLNRRKIRKAMTSSIWSYFFQHIFQPSPSKPHKKTS